MNYYNDTECYKDYFLVSFMREDGAVKHFEMYDGHPLDRGGIYRILDKGTVITFNGNHYDMPMIQLALSGADNAQLKAMSDNIINGMKTWGLDKPECNHIDIKEPAPGVMTGLKIYGGRLNSKKLQDLPIAPDQSIAPHERKLLRDYCVNDLETTRDLYLAIEKSIKLREGLSEKYEVDVRSKSDAQIAEALFRSYLSGKGIQVRKRQTEVLPFKYKVPEWLRFESPEFNEMLDKVRACTFTVSDKGKPEMPKELNKAIEFNGAKYKFGIGGLHSQEKKQVVEPKPHELFGEFDLSGMYPNIIIEQELYPLHLGPEFLVTYAWFVTERETMKARVYEIDDLIKSADGDELSRLKAEKSELNSTIQTYKIISNGSYGKFGSPYSFLYSPELLIQTTITGQLFLLMAIEKVTKVGGRVMSANTDGINVLYNRKDKAAINTALFETELLSGYNFEYTPYLATYNRDVNNYIAVKESGIKGKGAFAVGGLMKNPTNNVCVEAVISHLADDSSIETWVRNETDITKFLTVRKVTGGAEFRGEYLGGAIRFYHSTDGEVITYKKNGNKVPKSDGCKPMMDLGVFPDDIDYDWYINECYSMLGDLGCA